MSCVSFTWPILCRLLWLIPVKTFLTWEKATFSLVPRCEHLLFGGIQWVFCLFKWKQSDEENFEFYMPILQVILCGKGLCKICSKIFVLSYYWFSHANNRIKSPNFFVWLLSFKNVEGFVRLVWQDRIHFPLERMKEKFERKKYECQPDFPLLFPHRFCEF